MGTHSVKRVEGRRPQIYYVLSSEQFPLPELVKYGVMAEKAGFDGVWTSDHFQPWQPNEGHSSYAPVTLAALTQRTTKIKMGTGVTCPSFRYRPAIVAQAWASLSRLAPNRLFLGIGAGENLNEGAAGGGWGSYHERISRLIEGVKVIRALWSGKHVKRTSRYWNIDGRLYDPPVGKIPLYIAAGATHSANVSGRYGDGLITGAHDLKTKPELKTSWEKAAKNSGKDPRKLAIMVEHWVVVGDDLEAKRNAEKWRFIPRAWETGFFDNASPGAIQKRARQRISLDEVYDEWPVSSNPEPHIEAVEELCDLGATHIVIHSASSNQKKAVEFYGRKVLPRIRD